MGEELVQFLPARRLRESVEAPVACDRPGRAHETRPGAARERAADAHAPHAHRLHVLQCEFAGRADEQVHRLGRHGGDDCGDLLARADARRVQAIGTGFRISVETPDRVVEVGTADEEVLGAAHEHRAGAALVDRGTRGAHALHRVVDVAQRLALVVGGVLDRERSHARLDRHAHAFRDPFGILRIAGLEIRVHREARRLDHLPKVAERDLSRGRAVGAALRPGVTRARRRERLEAERFEVARAAGIPRIGNHEAAAAMQRPEGVAPGLDRCAHGVGSGSGSSRGNEVGQHTPLGPCSREKTPSLRSKREPDMEAPMKSPTFLRITALLAATAASMAFAQTNPVARPATQPSQPAMQPPAQATGQGNAPGPAENAARTTAGSADTRADVTSQAVSNAGRKRAASPEMAFVQEPVATATKAEGTDAQLGAAIVKALDADPSLKNSKITVQPDKGTVTLTGAALTRAQKQRAGEIAMAQAGQGKVVNIILDDET